MIIILLEKLLTPGKKPKKEVSHEKGSHDQFTFNMNLKIKEEKAQYQRSLPEMGYYNKRSDKEPTRIKKKNKN